MVNIILYPEYFDIKYSRRNGRRVPKKLAIERPNIEDISKILSELKIEFKVERDKCYPKSWWLKRGRISVEKKSSKTSLIKEIAIRLKTNHLERKG
jgi:signal recognition particle subunit SRP19